MQSVTRLRRVTQNPRQQRRVTHRAARTQGRRTQRAKLPAGNGRALAHRKQASRQTQSVENAPAERGLGEQATGALRARRRVRAPVRPRACSSACRERHAMNRRGTPKPGREETRQWRQSTDSTRQTANRHPRLPKARVPQPQAINDKEKQHHAPKSHPRQFQFMTVSDVGACAAHQAAQPRAQNVNEIVSRTVQHGNEQCQQQAGKRG